MEVKSYQNTTSFTRKCNAAGLFARTSCVRNKQNTAMGLNGLTSGEGKRGLIKRIVSFFSNITKIFSKKS